MENGKIEDKNNDNNKDTLNEIFDFFLVYTKYIFA